MIQEKKLPPSREMEFLLSVISSELKLNAQPDYILAGDLNWSELIQLANRHGVLPLFYKQVVRSTNGQIPQNQRENLEKAMQTCAEGNIRLAWKLVECLKLLSENGIECIVLKGPVLAIQEYGDLILRQFSDLDILIHESDFPKAFDVLVQSGYMQSLLLDQKGKKFQIWSNNHIEFNKQGDIFEVHWGIAPKENTYPLSPDQMWQELKSIKLFDIEINTLSTENTILFTCLHGAKHGWKQLKWIVDLAFVYREISENSWLNFLDQAKQNGFFRQICLGLLLAEELVGAEIPSKVHDLIYTDHKANRLANKVSADLIHNISSPSLFEDYQFYLETRERWQDRLYYLFSLIFVPKVPDWQKLSLPISLFGLYYIIRPLRLLYVLGRAVITGRT